MTTFDRPVLETLREELKRKLDQRARYQRKASQIVENVEARGDGQLTAAETSKLAEMRADIRHLDDNIDDLEARIDEIDDLNTRNGQREALARHLQPEPTPSGQRQYRVGREAQTYRPDAPFSFFGDLVAEKKGDRNAAERLQQHHAETRDIGTTTLGDGLVPPAYLPAEYAANLRAGRVTANLARRLPLPPEGMTVTVPLGTTGTVVTAQSDQNSAVTEIDFDATDLVVDVRTYAGQQDLSRQAIERGVGVDRVIFADLVADYNRVLNDDIITAAGTAGKHKGIRSAGSTLSVSVTTAGFAATHLAVVNAAGKIAAARYVSADVIVMHPRRWAWLATQTDSDGRPMLDLEGNGANAPGGGRVPGEGLVGSLAGVPVYVDASIPTTVSTSTFSGATEDLILVANSEDLLLWEDDVRRFRFDETIGGSLTVKLVVAGYSAFTAEWHPSGIAIVSGSALSTTLG